ncbi:MAG: ATP-dependent 6-phosphofructokinase [Planctomycetota bacterium]|nr:ATP-dependent 6-phosphofructokinase [Planctomycetota bacterium]
MPRAKRIAILTAGGDCPGLNAVIRAVVRTAQNAYGWEVWGVADGMEGFLKPRNEGLRLLTRNDVSGTIAHGGTILGASNRCDIFAVPDARGTPQDRSDRVLAAMKRLRLDALICVGGDGTQSAAHRLLQRGVPIVGVPKTIDNDVRGTDRSFGFDTVIGVVGEAIGRLYTTAQSHHRVMLCEVMGRDTGWIALHGGLASGAEAILIPEIPYDPDRLARKVQARMEHGKRFSVVVVSEGARSAGGPMTYRTDDDDRLGGVSFRIAAELRERTVLEVRHIVLGHIQRGGSPSPYDRVLASRMGEHAVQLIHAGAFGQMVALRGEKMTSYPIELAAQGPRRVPPRGPLVAQARALGATFAAADGSDDAAADARHLHGAP